MSIIIIIIIIPFITSIIIITFLQGFIRFAISYLITGGYLTIQNPADTHLTYSNDDDYDNDNYDDNSV
jgi:ABC-type sugar transport system permease subunit